MISIVFAYYNRRNLLITTINSIVKSKCNNLELVIVDDGSDEINRIDDLNVLFPTLDINVIRIEKNKKWWTNPCIPFNIGFHFAKGDTVVIQNPECLHIGDVLKYVEDNIALNKYIVFNCYAIDNLKTNFISGLDPNSSDYFNKIIHILNPTNNVPTSQVHGGNKWYQHPKFNPGYINFCTAITKSDLDDLGGFDEQYAKGIAKDDREFILRVRRKGMLIDPVNSPFVIHQWHRPFSYSDRVRVERNNKLYADLEKNKEYKVFNKLIKELVEAVIS